MTPVRHTGQDSSLPRRGWQSRLARLPIALYRGGFGAVLGRRLLLLHHTDRASGCIHHTVLEVIAYDAERGHWTLASTPDAAWYQDLRATPMATIQVRNRHYAVTARVPDADQGTEIARRHATALSRTMRRLCTAAGIVGNGAARTHTHSGRPIALMRLDAAPGQRLP